MELFIILGLTAISSILVGYLGVTLEFGLEQAKRNPLLEKSVSTILLFPVLEKFIAINDSHFEQAFDPFNTIIERFRKTVRRLKIALYVLLGIICLLLVLRMPPFLILIIFGCITFLFFKLNTVNK